MKAYHITSQGIMQFLLELTIVMIYIHWSQGENFSMMPIALKEKMKVKIIIEKEDKMLDSAITAERIRRIYPNVEVLIEAKQRDEVREVLYKFWQTFKGIRR